MDAFSGWRRRVLFIGVVCLIGFLVLAGLIRLGLMASVDVWVAEAVRGVWSPVLTTVMVVVTTGGQPVVLGAIAVVSGIVFAVRRRWFAAVLLLFGYAGGTLMVVLVKEVIQRARPPDGLVEASGYSFPSDHATAALLFFTILLILLSVLTRPRSRQVLLIGGAATAVLVISLSRVYLDVHWLSDIIGGWLFALAWLSVSLLLAVKGREKEKVTVPVR